MPRAAASPAAGHPGPVGLAARPVSATERKALVAEERIAVVRLMVIGFNVATYWGWLHPAGLGAPGLAAFVTFAALAYGVYDIIVQPYLRFPIMATATWTAVTDGVLITLWLHATGDFASPFYVLWYLSLVAVAFRFDWRASIVAALLYSFAYLALLALTGPLLAHAVDVAIRVAYIVLCGALGSLLAYESMRVLQRDVVLGEHMRTLQQNEVAREKMARLRVEEASARLAAVVESSIDGIHTKDLAGHVTSWNPACETLFGYTADEMVGKPSEVLCPPDRVAEERQMVAQVGRGMAVLVRETERIRKDGSRLWVSVSASPLRDASGEVVGCAAISRDITSARAYEREREQAREATARLAAVVDSSIDGILTKDLAGRITSWNGACQTMFGYSADEMVGRPITLLYPKGKEGEERSILDSIRAGKPVRIREAQRVRKDGSKIWVSVSASPLRDAAGTIVGAAAIKRDVTEARIAEKERLEAKARIQEFKRLQEVNRFKTQFINTAAHELRTPLLPLRMQLELMMTDDEHPPLPSQLDAMAVMRRNLDRLGALVEDLLTVARSQAGRIQLDLAPTDLATVLREAEQTFHTMAVRRGIRLSVDHGAVPPLLADGKRVGQVVANLLSNAFKFTPDGGEIRITLRPEKDGARVTVSDTGNGIAPADAARLFQPFIQVHDAAQVSQPGSGLGLYICRQLVELHGGAIGCESAGRGTGSTFWFTLPGIPFRPVSDDSTDWSPPP